jgi:hypothetical protein
MYSGNSESGSIGAPGCSRNPRTKITGNCPSAVSPGSTASSGVSGFAKTPNWTNYIEGEANKIGEGNTYWSCTAGDDVPYSEACMQERPIWSLNISGVLPDLACLADSSCMVEVKFVVKVQSLLGRNEMTRVRDGVIERSKTPDELLDLQRLMMLAPDPIRTAQLASIARGELYAGANVPLYEDEYVSVPGVVTVCGKPYLANMIYPDFLPAIYEITRGMEGVCANSGNEMCDYEKWREFVMNTSASWGRTNPNELLQAYLNY